MNSTVLENIKTLNKCRQSLKNGEYGLISESVFEDRMKKRFQEFYDRYPKIFEKAVRGFFENHDEINRLKLAINTQNDISSGKIPEKEGGVIFGQNLVDTYVKPQLKDNNTPHPDSLFNVQGNSTNTSNFTNSENIVNETNETVESDSDDELDEVDNKQSNKIGGLLKDIVMPTHELGVGDVKRRVKIDSDDESDEE
jgi:hypothetical protein